jgi:hypothetical protein
VDQPRYTPLYVGQLDGYHIPPHLIRQNSASRSYIPTDYIQPADRRLGDDTNDSNGFGELTRYGVINKRGGGSRLCTATTDVSAPTKLSVSCSVFLYLVYLARTNLRMADRF